MKKSALLLYIILLLSFTGCASSKMLDKYGTYDYKYEVAKQYFAEGKYNSAALLLQELIATYKGTNKGEESLFLLGMSSMNSHNYDAANAYFQKYYQAYPRGIYAQEARYYSGKSLYMSVPETRLDQTATYEAISEFNDFIETYPTSPLREQATDYILELQDRLVEKEYLSAKLYYNLGSYFSNCSSGGNNYQACIVTSENAIREYPYSSYREEFSLLVLKSKFELAKQSIEDKKEERYHNAIDEYYGFVNEYPESKYLKLAHELFKDTPGHYKAQEK